MTISPSLDDAGRLDRNSGVWGATKSSPLTVTRSLTRGSRPGPSKNRYCLCEGASQIFHRNRLPPGSASPSPRITPIPPVRSRTNADRLFALLYYEHDPNAPYCRLPAPALWAYARCSRSGHVIAPVADSGGPETPSACISADFDSDGDADI